MKFALLNLFLGGCSLLSQYPDSVIEERVEDFIEEETGIEVDFTGSTPEVVGVRWVFLEF